MNIGPFLALALLSFSRRMVAPVRGVITSRFNEQRDGYRHNGTDVAAPIGTPLRAPFDARITGVFITDRGGIQVTMRSLESPTMDFVAGFAHLQRSLVGIGEVVNAGNIFAESGNTGHSTGPHVHITLRDPVGNYVNPESYINLNA